MMRNMPREDHPGEGDHRVSLERHTRADALFSALGRNVVRFRYPIVVLWVLFVALTSAFPNLSSEVNNDNSQFLPASAPSSRAASLGAPILGSATKSSEVRIVVASRKGPLSAADLASLSPLVAVIRHIPHVEAVKELGISADRQALQLGVRSGISRTDVRLQKPLVKGLEAALRSVRLPPALTAAPAGQIATNVANQVASEKTGNRTQLLSIAFIVVLLLLIFRSLLAPIVTLLPAALSLLISMRLIGELGANGLKISEITQLLLIILVLGAGTDYGLFLVFRTREQLRAGESGHAAVERALTRVGESITASAGTVIVALLTLLLASFGIYRDLGIPLAIGIAVILLAGLTLLPALLAIFGRAVFWPSRVREGDASEGAWGRVAGRLVSQPKLTLAAGVLLLAALALAALGYHSSGFSGAANAPKGSSAAAGNALVSKHFPRSSANPANLIFRYREPVWSDPQQIIAAERSLIASHRFKSLLGPLAPNGTTLTPAQYSSLHAKLGPPGLLPPTPPRSSSVPVALYNAYRASASFVGPSGHVVQFEASLAAGGQQSTAAMNATPQTRTAVSAAARSSGAVASGLAGEAAALYDVSQTSNKDLLNIVPVAIVAIALLLALVLRSLIAPLYLIVSVAFSYLAALGVSVLIFVDIVGEAGLTFILPFLMFIFLLALGEDYNILVMTRIREEARTLPLKDAVTAAVGRTGTTVTSAGLVLAGTFGVLAIAAGSSASGGQVRAVGFGLAIGILMDTFVVRTLLVPATVALLGRWNWWPAQMGRRTRPHDLKARRKPLPAVDSPGD